MDDLSLIKEANATRSHGESWRISVSLHVSLGSVPHVAWRQAAGEV